VIKKRVGIIGSGVSGLSASIRLANMGYKVHVFEANGYPGGKLTSFKLGDYRFDAGPPLFTMPKYVDELFHLSNENPRDFFNYKKKDIICKYFWQDGKKLVAHADKDKFFDEVYSEFGVDKKIIKEYLNKAKKKYDLTSDLFLKKSLHKFDTFLSAKTIKALSNLSIFEIGKTLSEVNESFLKEPHLVQFYNRYATYNGSSPYSTPGIMTVIQHLESHYGTYIPNGGMHNITKSLYELAKRKGVIFNFNNFVSEIILKKNCAIGLVVDDKSLFFDTVISNMDIYPTYEKLLPKRKIPTNIKYQERSSSAVIFYWGISKRFQNLDLHNVFFSKDYRNEFDSIFNKKSISSDPTVYVNITSKDIPTDSPENHENWFVMVNTCCDSGQDWDLEVKKLKKIVLERLEGMLGESISPFIEEEKILTPKTIEKMTNSYKGSLYGSSSNGLFSAFLRHPNFSRKIKNLYFCGGSVHPGGGIPLCLLSAKITTELINKN
jgi:phytoene desaturase